MAKLKYYIKSMRLRTLPLSLAGVLMGSLLAVADYRVPAAVVLLVCLTTVLLQILSNLSNELGDVLHGTDTPDRVGPEYGLNSGELTVKEMKGCIGVILALCIASGLAMIWLSFGTLFCMESLILIILGAAAIFAAMRYTLGRNPYGYRAMGDFYVFVFFGLVSVLGAYFVIAHTIDLKLWLICPAVGMGLLSVAVLNVNNIRDMATDQGIRKTVPLRIGERRAKWYQTILVVVGAACFLYVFSSALFLFWFLFAVPIVGLGIHLVIVWRCRGKYLDPALPLLVFSTFFLSIIYPIVIHGLI